MPSKVYPAWNGSERDIENSYMNNEKIIILFDSMLHVSSLFKKKMKLKILVNIKKMKSKNGME